MKHGSTNTTLKRRDKLHNERLSIPQDKKIPSAQIKSHKNDADFFILEGLFIVNLINQVYYLELLERLREKVRRKRPELFANNSWILHYDNASTHTALSMKGF
jgi:alpha-L-fucosidase